MQKSDIQVDGEYAVAMVALGLGQLRHEEETGSLVRVHLFVDPPSNGLDVERYSGLARASDPPPGEVVLPVTIISLSGSDVLGVEAPFGHLVEVRQYHDEHQGAGPFVYEGEGARAPRYELVWPIPPPRDPAKGES